MSTRHSRFDAPIGIEGQVNCLLAADDAFLAAVLIDLGESRLT